MESGKGPQVKKPKKKPVKDELDRIKQAEKKKRRLEKALATSAAIRSELEKKKQQKKEEQERLDEEGAAIAEAVALHVLLGEEDSDDPRIVLGKDHNKPGEWHHAPNIGLFMDKTTLSRQNLKRCSVDNGGWFPGAYRSGLEWNHGDISVGLFAAQAVGSLRLGEDEQVDIPVFFNRY